VSIYFATAQGHAVCCPKGAISRVTERFFRIHDYDLVPRSCTMRVSHPGPFRIPAARRPLHCFTSLRLACIEHDKIRRGRRIRARPTRARTGDQH